MRLLIFSIVAVLAFAATEISAQGIAGKEFLFSMPLNFREPNPTSTPPQYRHSSVISCCVSSRTPVDVVVRANGQSYDTIVHAEPGKPAIFMLPQSVVMSSTDTVEHRSISIVAKQPISVTVANYRFQSTESFSVLPKNYYGSDYRIASYLDLAPDLRGVATITAVENGTHVTVSAAPGSTMPFIKEFDLNANQTVRISTPQYNSDLTGASIVANKPVSVISGHTCAYVPAKVDACNLLAEHLPPLGLLGRNTVVPKLPGKAYDVVRVVGTQDATTVTFKDSVYTVNAGQFVEFRNSDLVPTNLTATNPVLVILYSTGFRSGDSLGDPTMLLLPPTDLWQRTATCINPISEVWKPEVVIIIPTEGVESLRLNGLPLVNASVVNNSKGYSQVTVPLLGREAFVNSGFKMMVATVCLMGKSTTNAYDGWAHMNTWAVPDP